ncbi:MAG: T9SS type A sorting domain-containing protein [candidate division WOR-3 bacterium]
MKRLVLICGLLLADIGLAFAGYGFDFYCRGDTVQRVSPGAEAIFHFTLTNTGTEPDVYEFDCRVIQAVPGWSVIYCVRGLCTEPGVLMYDTLDVGAQDTTPEVSVFTTTTQGEEIVSLRVRSLGNPALAESIATHTIVGAGIEERMDGSTRTMNEGTFVRRFLFLSDGVTACLFDISGRKVMELRPGLNGLCYLPAGVYLFRMNSGSESAVRKVIVR